MLLRAAQIEESSSDTSSSDTTLSIEDSSSGSYGEESEKDDSGGQDVVNDDANNEQDSVACDEEVSICAGEGGIVSGDEQSGFANDDKIGGAANVVTRDCQDENSVDFNEEWDDSSCERIDVSGYAETGYVASGEQNVDTGDDRDDDDVDFSGEQDGFSDGQGDVGGDRLASVTDILKKIKRESLAASLAGSLDDLADSNAYVKKKKKAKRARERPTSFIGPLVNYPDSSESFPSAVDDDAIKWIRANCCREGGIEAHIPNENECPWMIPDGWICVYDFWFTEYHLWFPLPRLLLPYC